MVGTPKNPPARHKTFGISDSLLDAVKKVHAHTHETHMQEDIEVTRDPNHRHIKDLNKDMQEIQYLQDQELRVNLVQLVQNNQDLKDLLGAWALYTTI